MDENFLLDRSVVVNGEFSNTFAVNAGVLQGSILSQTSFLLHTNGLLESTNSFFFSFADYI